jgi:hypothetical protein
MYKKRKFHAGPGHESPVGEQKHSSTLSLTSGWIGVGGQRHIPSALLLGKRHGTQFTGGWVGPRADVDGCEKSRPHQYSIS